MRVRLLLPLVLLLPACGGGEDVGPDLSRCGVVREAVAKQDEKVKAAREAYNRSVRDREPLRLDRIRQSRILSQLVVADPDCFTPEEVATTQEYLDSTD